MASVGLKTALQALTVDDVLSGSCYSSYSGKPLRNGVFPGSGSNLEVPGTSLCRLAAVSSSRNSQPLDVQGPSNDAAVGGDGLKVLEISMMSDQGEVKSMLVEFLQARGVNGSLATRAVNKATRLTAHLLSLLRMVYRIRYLTGRELTASEIRSSLSPFLEKLGAEQDKVGLVDVFISFPDAPSVKTKNLDSYYFGDSFTSPVLGEVKFRSFPQLQAHMVYGKLPLSLVYLLELGFPPDDVANVVSQFPSIASHSVEGRVKPIIDFLLGLGIHVTDIPKIILRRPQLFGCSLEENIKPTVALLKELGVDSEGWVKILSQFPHILTYSLGKVQQVVSFLSEIGLSPKESGKALTRFPQIIGYSINAKLKPFADYFHSIGVKDLKTLVSRSPQLMGLSLELNIKPTVLFFSENGYTSEELSTIILRFPQLLGLSTEGNLRPKWDYFLQMDRPNSELVDFPQYFGYSLEKRIKPRYEALEMRGIKWSLNRTLSLTGPQFLKHMEKETELTGLVQNLDLRESDGYQ
ncbi:hypothetical protein M758_7G090900 [Ceratodon purpureus]|nr:hypothetical protein M758_7G090900 [Ceratodon purpureus]KAG0610782.1 hypothetical protein M758_7G090900 [Ceratodon purpureus]